MHIAAHQYNASQRPPGSIVHSGADSQLEEIEEATEGARREEAVAKAVLNAAQRAAREGLYLSAAEISEIRELVLNPPSPEELAMQRKADQEVNNVNIVIAHHGIIGTIAIINIQELG